MGSNSFSSWTSSFCLRLPPCWQCNPWVGCSHVNVISLLIGMVGIAFHSLSLYIHGRTIVRLSIYGWLMSHLVWCEQQQDHPSAPSRIEAEKNYARLKFWIHPIDKSIMESREERQGRSIRGGGVRVASQLVDGAPRLCKITPTFLHYESPIY